MKDPNENRPGFKKTKVGWIPEEWVVTLASDHKPFVTSGSRGWAEYYSAHGNLFLRITNLNRESPKPDLTDRVNVKIPSDLTEGKRTILCAGDIVVSITADLGIIGYIDDKFPANSYVSQHLAILRFPKKTAVNRLYVAYSLSGDCLRHHFYRITDQGAKAGLNLDAIRELPIILPKLPEQKKVAEILSACDGVIDRTRDLVAAKQQQKKGLMQGLLTGKKRLPGFREKWQHRRIGEMFKEVSRPVKWDDNNEYSLLSVRRRSGGVFLREKLKGSEIATKVMFTAHAGDFLISKMQVLHGATGIVPPELGGYHISGSYISLRPKDGNLITPAFFARLSEMHQFRHLTYLCSYGVHIEKMTFNLDWFLDSKILVPPTLDEQQAVVDILAAADAEIGALESKLTALQQQKKGLMQKLLTGQIRVKP